MAKLHVALVVLPAALLAGCMTEWGGGDDGPPPPVIPDEYDRGVYQYGQQDYQDAIDSFSHVIQVRPDWEPPYIMRGNAYMRIIDTGKLKWTERQYTVLAAVDFGRAIQLNPANPEPRFHRALAYIVLRKYDQAIDDLLYLTDTLTPTRPDPHLIAGLLFEEKYEGLEHLALRHYIAYIRNGGTNLLIQDRIRALQALSLIRPPPVKPVDVKDEERERRAKELFGEYGHAFMQQDRDRMIQALEELLNSYGDTEFVKPMKETIQTLLKQYKQP